MKYFEMDIFEQMDAIIDDLFTEWDKVITYEEPEEEEPEEPEEEEEEEEYNPWKDEDSWEYRRTASGFLAGMY